MSENKIDIRFGAQTAELKAGTQEAANSVQTAAQQITAAFARMNAETVASMQGVNTSIAGATNGIAVAVGTIKSAMVALTTAIAGGVAFKSLVQESAFLAARVETLGIVMNTVGKNAGYSEAEMRTYAESVKAMGITTRESIQTVTRMAQAQLDLNKASALARVAQDAAVIGNMNSSEALNALLHGITTLQPEILRNIGIVVNFEAEYKKFATTVGRASESLSYQEKQQIAMNAVLREGQKISGTYEAAMGTVGKQIGSLARPLEEAKVKFGQLFTPALLDAVKLTGNAIGYVNDQLERLVAGLGRSDRASNLYSQMAKIDAEIKRLEGGFFGILKPRSEKMLEGIPGDQWTILESQLAVLREKRLLLAQELLDLQSAPAKGTGKSTASDKGKDSGTTTPRGESRFAAWEEEYRKSYAEAMKESGKFFERSIEEEKRFWEEKKGLTKAGSSERLQVERRISDLGISSFRNVYEQDLVQLQRQIDAENTAGEQRVQAARDRANKIGEAMNWQGREYEAALRYVEQTQREHEAKLKQLKESRIDVEKELALIGVQIEEDNISFLASMNAVSAEQEIALRRETERKKYEIERQALLDRLALSNLTIKEKQDLEIALQKIDAQYRRTSAKFDRDAEKERRKTWDDLYTSISGSFSMAIRSMTTSTLSFVGVIRNLALSIVDAFADMGAKIAANWIKDKLTLLAQGKAVETAQAMSSISKSAATGAAGAYASATSTPGIGWIIAPAIAAAAMAAILAFKGTASAVKGYDIPAGVNPVTQLHQREMVLPAQYADVIRSMANGQQGGEGSLKLKLKGVNPGDYIRVADLEKHLKRLNRDYRITPRTLR